MYQVTAWVFQRNYAELLYLLQDQNDLKGELKNYLSTAKLNIRKEIKDQYAKLKDLDKGVQSKRLQPHIANLFKELTLQYFFFDYVRLLYSAYKSKSEIIDDHDTYKKAVIKRENMNFYYQMLKDHRFRRWRKRVEDSDARVIEPDSLS